MEAHYILYELLINFDLHDMTPIIDDFQFLITLIN